MTDTLSLLKSALPYVERVAATTPTEPARMQRQREASKLANAIREHIASHEQQAA